MKKGAVSENNFKWKNVILLSLILLLIVLAYAVIRYNIIKGVPWQDFPLFIFNKALALASVVFIVLSFILGPFSRFWPNKFTKYLQLRKYFGLLGFGFASVHSLISLLIFSPSYYPKFFEETGKLNLTGELSMIFGVLGFFIFLIVAITSISSVSNSIKPENWLIIHRLGYLAFIFVLLHVLVMGLEGWFNPADWPGKLLPISLIAFLIIVITIFFKMIAVMLPPQEVKK